MFREIQSDEDREKLQQDIDELLIWSKKWQLPFNESKCKVIWAAVFTFNPYLLISINGIIDINNSFIDINKYGHIIHLY